MPTIDEQIEQDLIDGVQKASVDGRTAEGIPISDRIAGAQYIAGVDAVPSGTGALGRAIRIQRGVPPGAGPT